MTMGSPPTAGRCEARPPALGRGCAVRLFGGLHDGLAGGPRLEHARAAQQHERENDRAEHRQRDPREAVAGAHLISTDVWTSMGQEEETAKRLKLFTPFQVDRALLDLAAQDVLFMHCLPAHRGEEISLDLLDDPRSVAWDQAENRLHAQKALLEFLVQPAYQPV